jgi:hypothetical protein
VSFSSSGPALLRFSGKRMEPVGVLGVRSLVGGVRGNRRSDVKVGAGRRYEIAQQWYMPLAKGLMISARVRPQMISGSRGTTSAAAKTMSCTLWTLFLCYNTFIQCCAQPLRSVDELHWTRSILKVGNSDRAFPMAYLRSCKYPPPTTGTS